LKFKPPHTFECGARTITVERVDRFDEPDRVADWHNHLAKIRILDTKDIPPDSQNQNFWHECIHCVLETYGLEEYSDKEGLVEAISQGVCQILKTAK
jgi:hypothetical protein